MSSVENKQASDQISDNEMSNNEQDQPSLDSDSNSLNSINEEDREEFMLDLKESDEDDQDYYDQVPRIELPFIPNGSQLFSNTDNNLVLSYLKTLEMANFTEECLEIMANTMWTIFSSEYDAVIMEWFASNASAETTAKYLRQILWLLQKLLFISSYSDNKYILKRVLKSYIGLFIQTKAYPLDAWADNLDALKNLMQRLSPNFWDIVGSIIDKIDDGGITDADIQDLEGPDRKMVDILLFQRWESKGGLIVDIMDDIQWDMTAKCEKGMRDEIQNAIMNASNVNDDICDVIWSYVYCEHNPFDIVINLAQKYYNRDQEMFECCLGFIVTAVIAVPACFGFKRKRVLQNGLIDLLDDVIEHPSPCPVEILYVMLKCLDKDKTLEKVRQCMLKLNEIKMEFWENLNVRHSINDDVDGIVIKINQLMNNIDINADIHDFKKSIAEFFNLFNSN